MSEHAEEQPQLTLEQRQALREQFIEVYSEQQTTFDNSVRTLSSAGVAVTVSLAAALKEDASSREVGGRPVRRDPRA